MKAMILSAGEGTRLGKLTEKTPKVMLPVGGKPVIEHIIEWLKKYGVFEIVINLHYLGGKIQEHIGNGSKFEVDAKYTFEDELLGTAGGVRNAEVFLSNSFIVVNGDTLTNFNLLDMIIEHRQSGALATIALCSRKQLRNGGLVTLDMRNKISGFAETEIKGAVGLVNAGVYIFEKGILPYISDGFSDFGCDVFPKIAGLNLPVYGFVLNSKDFVVDIGTPEGYERAKGIYGS